MRFGRTPPPPEPEGPQPGQPYEGPVCFASDGFHYPVLFDPDGNELGPDRDHPLVVRGETLLHAAPNDRSHFHEYGRNEVELVPGTED
jgi:hypothetical protein